MVLRHFTSPRYLNSIREHGVVSLKEKRERGLYPPGVTPPSIPEFFPGEDDIIWLTRSNYIHITDTDLAVVEFDNIPEAVAWRTAHTKWRVPQVWLKILEKSALEINPQNKMNDWYVTTGHISPDRISRMYTLTKEEAEGAVHMS